MSVIATLIEPRRPPARRCRFCSPTCRHWQPKRSAAVIAVRKRTLRQILGRMRHDGCGGRAGKAELLIGLEGVSSRPVPRPPSRVAT